MSGAKSPAREYPSKNFHWHVHACGLDNFTDNLFLEVGRSKGGANMIIALFERPAAVDEGIATSL